MSEKFKICVVENNYDKYVSFFNLINVTYFFNNLDFSYYPRSQDLNLTKINDFKLIFMDLSLAPTSEYDGYALVDIIQKINPHPPIAIFTGRSFAHKTARDNIIRDLDILIKPVQPDALCSVIKKYMT